LNKDAITKEFTELIEDNQGIIFKVSAMYCNDFVCREDLVQEILLQLWRSFPSFDKTRKYSTWMYRIALNTAISQWRKDKTRKEDSTDKLPVNVTDDRNNNSFVIFAIHHIFFNQGLHLFFLKSTEQSHN